MLDPCNKSLLYPRATHSITALQRVKSANCSSVHVAALPPLNALMLLDFCALRAQVLRLFSFCISSQLSWCDPVCVAVLWHRHITQCLTLVSISVWMLSTEGHSQLLRYYRNNRASLWKVLQQPEFRDINSLLYLTPKIHFGLKWRTEDENSLSTLHSIDAAAHLMSELLTQSCYWGRRKD